MKDFFSEMLKFEVNLTDVKIIETSKGIYLKTNKPKYLVRRLSLDTKIDYPKDKNIAVIHVSLNKYKKESLWKFHNLGEDNESNI